mmetsp:Transcript_9153/g.8108  ORF Transcript_9153/g.8108 Transcript_9153/m.8108 type:complete len:129 (+) Transcript_9153:20-406(+)
MDFGNNKNVISDDFYKTSTLLKVLQSILSDKEKIKMVADAAFEAVDVDNSGDLDKEELTEIMQTVAFDMSVKQPSESDVEAVLREVDDNYDGKVDKLEFVQLIERVLMKLLESEEELQKTINAKFIKK